MCTVYVKFARKIMDLFLDGNLLGSLDLDLFQDSTQLNPAEGFAQCKTYTLIEREDQKDRRRGGGNGVKNSIYSV